jgi:hypothetical protein
VGPRLCLETLLAEAADQEEAARLIQRMAQVDQEQRGKVTLAEAGQILVVIMAAVVAVALAPLAQMELAVLEATAALD